MTHRHHAEMQEVINAIKARPIAGVCVEQGLGRHLKLLMRATVPLLPTALANF